MKPEEAKTRDEMGMIICNILGMPVRSWLYITALILFFMALCAIIFA